MPRRAVRAVHRDHDLRGVLLEHDDLPAPWDPGKVFGADRADAPLEVEIGSGKGLFLRGAAAASPGRNYLGVEIAYKYARYLAACLVRDGQTNARVLAGDGARLLSAVLPDASVAAVHVYFPDPWWKKRHAKRRLMVNPPFLAAIGRVLAPGGELHFWTDVREYYEAALAVLAELRQAPALASTRDASAAGPPSGGSPSGGSAPGGLPLEGPFDVPETPAEHEMDFRTHFERRTRLNDQPVFRARYVKL